MSECSTSEPEHYCSGFSFQNTWALCNHFSLQFSPCVSWRDLQMQLNSACLPNCRSWSAGDKTDAVRCWLVHRGHTGCLFLTDFSLFPWLHFYQQHLAGKHSQHLIVSISSSRSWGRSKYHSFLIVRGGSLGSAVMFWLSPLFCCYCTDRHCASPVQLALLLAVHGVILGHTTNQKQIPQTQ